MTPDLNSSLSLFSRLCSPLSKTKFVLLLGMWGLLQPRIPCATSIDWLRTWVYGSIRHKGFSDFVFPSLFLVCPPGTTPGDSRSLVDSKEIDAQFQKSMAPFFLS